MLGVCKGELATLTLAGSWHDLLMGETLEQRLLALVLVLTLVFLPLPAAETFGFLWLATAVEAKRPLLVESNGSASCLGMTFEAAR